MIEIKITGETAQDTLNDLASLAASFGGGTVVVQGAAVTTTKKKTTKADPDPGTPVVNTTAASTVTPKFKLEELQELNGKVDDKLAVKKLVNAFFYTDPASGEKKSVERMTQLEAKDYDTYAAHVQLLIDTQV